MHLKNNIRTFFVLLLFLVLLLPMQIIQADPNQNTETDRSVTFPDGTRHRAGEVQIIPLYEITADHPLYEVVIRSIEQQFGVQGGISGLAESASQHIASQQEQQRLRRQAEQRRNLIVLATSSAIFAISWLRSHIKKSDQDLESITSTDMEMPNHLPDNE